ncbi:MAG: hypothetical protein OXH20_02500 [bacterium]|nr:hypothetical protein [bacterium]MDE0668834.1 hypothetical protein [bacterium]MXZ31124.1 hypothetical protein [Acidimicrobiia bacterium]MYB23910.1 hypothetical protein [Acidimicrobiia bacterium]MYJ13467.1 hypothetical protein [Acidimicrobiia bacterium]
MEAASIRVDATTHRSLETLATSLNTTVSATVALAVKNLLQRRMGAQLNRDLTPEEVAWLDADLDPDLG